MGVGGVRTRRRYIAYAAGPCRGLPWVDFFVHNNTCPTRGLPRIIRDMEGMNFDLLDVDLSTVLAEGAA